MEKVWTGFFNGDENILLLFFVFFFYCCRCLNFQRDRSLIFCDVENGCTQIYRNIMMDLSLCIINLEKFSFNYLKMLWYVFDICFNC